MSGTAAAAPQRGNDAAASPAAFGFAPEDVGWFVFDVADGATVRARNADRAYIPASILKIPTTLIALELLGAEHRFETGVYARGDVVDGVLRGDLFLRGGGDPMLTSDDLAALAGAVQAQGIAGVAGHFMYDATALARFDRIEVTQPVAAGYNTGISALSVNFNRVLLAWSSADAPSLRAISSGMQVPVDWIGLAPAPAETPAEFPFQRADGAREIWLLSPHLPTRGEEWLPVADAARHTAMLFRSIAAGAGLALPQPEPGRVPAGTALVARHAGDPLPRVAARVLRYSNNLAAELIGMTATERLRPGPLAPVESAEAMAGWLRERLPAVDWRGFDPRNHSGLNSAARATPRQMTAILQYALGRSHDGVEYAALLPTIRWADPKPRKGRRRGPGVAVRAKTGTIAWARALLGELDARDGRRLGFVLFIADLDRRRAFDAEADPRELGIPPESRVWLGRARDLEEALVRKWME